MASLQRRIVAGGIIWSVVTVAVGAFSMLTVFDRMSIDRFNDLLTERHAQAVVALGNAQPPELIEAFLTDPAYQRPYSGRYWQIDGPDGAVLASRSLFDAALAPPGGAEMGRVGWNGISS